MTKIIKYLSLSLCIVFTSAQAHKYEPICIDTADDQRICTKYPHATITQDELGNVVCGLGECAKDDLGNLICSDKPNGHVRVDSMGNINCKGNCVAASESYCNIIPEGQVEDTFSDDKNADLK